MMMNCELMIDRSYFNERKKHVYKVDTSFVFFALAIHNRKGMRINGHDM